MGDEEKHGSGDGGDKRKGYYRRYLPGDTRRAISAFLVIFLLLAGITALVVWLVYRPHKPKFTVVGAAIYDLNTSTPPFISTTMQFTIVTRNPNDRVSIYYDHLSAFVSYKNQAITPPMMLPPLYHDKDSTAALSPVLGGGKGGEGCVPVSPEVANGLVTDQGYGMVALKLILLGKLRWKAGAIKTGWYGLYVKCDMLVGMRREVVGEVLHNIGEQWDTSTKFSCTKQNAISYVLSPRKSSRRTWLVHGGLQQRT